MKKIVGIVAFLCGMLSFASAQTSLGLRAGVNIAKQSISESMLSTQAIAGYYIGAFADIGVLGRWSIQPELQVALHGSKIVPAKTEVKTTLRYIYLPVLVQYQLPGNLKVGLGGQVGYGIGGSIKENGQKTEELDNQLDAGMVASVSYRLPWEGLGVGTRYYLGLVNQNEMDPKITNRVISIGINYRF